MTFEILQKENDMQERKTNLTTCFIAKLIGNFLLLSFITFGETETKCRAQQILTHSLSKGKSEKERKKNLNKSE